ncbi:SNF2-related protein [Dermacoccus abyssi]|uniref:SNF2-related protein n=1 Tax=Dermacoccus abyssi TaxID=322596 RepID=UPI002AD42CE8|nr:SNF2-related protein [Dermacoccus abyssi]
MEAYALHNVWDVLKFQEKYLLASLSGLGETSAKAITQASLRLLEAVRDETPVRIDVKRRSKKTEALLDALRQWDAARRFDPSKEEVALAKGLEALFKANRSAEAVVTFNRGPSPAGGHVVETLADALKRSAPASTDGDIWTDFLSRPSDYFGMLTELGLVTEDEKKMHGDLPEESIEAVRAKELKRDYLTASLRTYQSFGARFALVQEKVVIGDEMGLGKTVEALAIFTHLRATGHSHFLVVCPAAVVSNWIRETAKHTKLSASRLHGPLWERKYAAKSWLRNGGVAVTTYDLLPWAREHLNNVEVASAVFDEAHYIKNPNAKRSLAAAEVMDALKYVVLMTGTLLKTAFRSSAT